MRNFKVKERDRLPAVIPYRAPPIEPYMARVIFTRQLLDNCYNNAMYMVEYYRTALVARENQLRLLNSLD